MWSPSTHRTAHHIQFSNIYILISCHRRRTTWLHVLNWMVCAVGVWLCTTSVVNDTMYGYTYIHYMWSVVYKPKWCVDEWNLHRGMCGKPHRPCQRDIILIKANRIILNVRAYILFGSQYPHATVAAAAAAVADEVIRCRIGWLVFTAQFVVFLWAIDTL